VFATLRAFRRDKAGRAPSPRAICAIGACIAASLILAVAPASAAPPNFCPAGSGAGQCNSPVAVAVDQSSGTVYVGEFNNNRVSEFDQEGHFLRAFGLGVATGASELQTCTSVCVEGREGSAPGAVRPTAIAIDPSSRDVYVADSPNGRIEKFNEAGQLLLTFAGCGTSRQCPLAVDSSGNLWAGDMGRLREFSSAGAPLSEVKLPAAGIVRSLAVDVFGDFYAATALNSLQEIVPPASGTYALTSHKKTTATLSFNASAAEVESALDTALGAHFFTVEGPAGGPFKAEFTLPGRSLGEFPISASAGSVTTVQEGGPPRRVDKLDPFGVLLEALDEGGHPNALARDPATGNLFVSDQLEPEQAETEGTAILLQFSPSGAQTEAFGFGEVLGAPAGNALSFGDTAQRLYVVGASGAQAFPLLEPGPHPESATTVANPIGKTTATLSAQVNPEGHGTTYHFQYITTKNYEEDANTFGAGTEETAESASIGADFKAHPASQALSGLTPATAYRFRLVATNECEPVEHPGHQCVINGETAEFATLPPAAIDSTSASEVTAESATLQADINPLGDATSYRFEFLTEAAYLHNEAEALAPFTGATQAPLEPAPIGAGQADVAVSQHLQHLQPHTAYRYRVVISNAVSEAHGGPFAGPVLAFTTQAAGATGLPDNRGYELVSPPDKRGAKLHPIIASVVVQAAASGDAITYLASAPTEAQPQGYGGTVVQLLSAHGTAGWVSRDLAAPHRSATGSGEPWGPEYRLFSADLSLAVLQPHGAFEPTLSPAASEQGPYLRSDFPPAAPTEFCTSSCYHPFVTACPNEPEPCPPAVAEAADVPPGTTFGQEGQCPSPEVGQQQSCGPKVLGATPDLSHVVISSGDRLAAPPGDKGGLYEWTAGRPPADSLQFISVLPGEPPKAPTGESTLGDGNAVARNAISADGSRVIWSASERGTLSQHLYLRDLARGDSVQLDAVEGGPGASQPAEPHFQLASEDGSRVFFTDSQQLTAGSGAGNDLYECQIVEDSAGKLQCQLADLTPPNAGEPAAVQGTIAGASADGSYLYFVANGALAPLAAPGDCHKEGGSPGHGSCNLYVRHAGATTFIATLSGADFPDWNTLTLKELTARVSPDGRWLAFMSERPLTGYDNRDAVSGKPDEELYLYHAPAAGGEGTLVCASCDTTGARPHGKEWATLTGLGAGGGEGLVGAVEKTWQGDQWLAASVPGWTSYHARGVGAALYQPRYLSDGGRLFFNSSDALVPSDSNGNEDVYQYEPPGVGGCSESTPTFGRASRGCVDLISSGSSKEESAFLDASESGNDVFFLTHAQLSPRDSDTALDVYDARVGGGEAEPAPPVECGGDACQSPGPAPEDPTPGSLTFQGSGNLTPLAPTPPKPKSAAQIRAEKLTKALKACKRYRKKSRRVSCEKSARRKYAPAKKAKSAKRAPNDRRATR
jgi:hypothetical protein